MFSGNEACDADSMCSAICMAFLKHNKAALPATTAEGDASILHVPGEPIIWRGTTGSYLRKTERRVTLVVYLSAVRWEGLRHHCALLFDEGTLENISSGPVMMPPYLSVKTLFGWVSSCNPNASPNFPQPLPGHWALLALLGTASA